MRISGIAGAGFSTLALLSLAGGAAFAQSSEPRITLYGSTGYNKPLMTVSGPIEDIDIGVPIHSAKVLSGTWQLCPRNNFRGNCLIVTDGVKSLKKEMGLLSKLSSVRPVASAAAAAEPAATPAYVPVPVPETTETVAPRAASAAPSAPPLSLRGRNAEFFPVPTQNGVRLTGGGSAAKQFCRAHGWKEAEHYARESAPDGSETLIDLLCVGED